MASMMPKVRQVKVRVPATSANLGSGFDTVGLALDYHDELTFTLNPNITEDNSDTTAKVIIHGEGEDTLPHDETHLVVSAFRRACEAFGLRRFGFTLEAQNNIPQARGMGSSAEAIVAGIAAAAAFAQGDADFNRETIFQMAAQMEGHPDNVAPAVYGGLTVSWNFETAEGVGSVAIPGGEPLCAGFHTVNYPVVKAMTAAVFVPDFELSTQKAREALPQKLPYKDAVFNISRVALLPAAMNPVNLVSDSANQTQNDDSAVASRSNALLFTATQDKLHQPYRKGLMQPSWKLIEILRAKGFAAAVSGAGSCVMVLHYGDASAQIDNVAATQLSSGRWRVLHLLVSSQGVQIEVER